MRAVVHDRYGPPEVLRVNDVERPVPEEDEVLGRVQASTVTAATQWACAARITGSPGSSPAFAD
jgi:NADPH:quinone reductase-like Zn-dependent oxidoreductase